MSMKVKVVESGSGWTWFCENEADGALLVYAPRTYSSKEDALDALDTVLNQFRSDVTVVEAELGTEETIVLVEYQAEGAH